jgi:hypothetical protein
MKTLDEEMSLALMLLDIFLDCTILFITIFSMAIIVENILMRIYNFYFSMLTKHNKEI